MYVFVGHFLATEIFIGQCLEAEVVEVIIWCLGWVAYTYATESKTNVSYSLNVRYNLLVLSLNILLCIANMPVLCGCMH